MRQYDPAVVRRIGVCVLCCTAALVVGCGEDDAKEEGDELASCLRGKGLKVSQVLPESLHRNPTYDAVDQSAEGFGGTVVIGHDRKATPDVVFFVMKDPTEAKEGKEDLDKLAPGAEVHDNVLLGVVGRKGGKPDPGQRRAIDPCLDEL
jgi:hypothetical protein